MQVRPYRTKRLGCLMLQVTLLHLSTVKQLLRSALAKHAVDVVEARVRSLYDSLPQGQWALLRQTLAGFLLGKRVKVRHPPCWGAHLKPEQPQGQWALLRQTLAGPVLGESIKVRHEARARARGALREHLAPHGKAAQHFTAMEP